MTLRESQHAQRTLIDRLGPYPSIEARDGLHIVVEDVGAGIENTRDGLLVAQEIRRKHFDSRFGQEPPHFFDCFREVHAAAIGQLVTVDACDDDVAQLHALCHFGDVAWLRWVETFGSSLGYRAETATPRTDVSQNHERRGFATETFVNIGAAS